MGSRIEMSYGSDVISIDQFRDQATAWVEANEEQAPYDYGPIVPLSQLDRARSWQRHMHNEGYAGIHWAAEHGGRGLTGDHHRVFAEACQAAGIPSILNMVGLVLAAGALRLFGTPEQQRDHLPPTVTGERVWCQLFSEPEAGSDLAGLRTRAELDGDEWVVNGQKVWTSTGTHSDWAILMARTEPDASKHAGISFFVLDMATPGIEARPLRNMAGTAEFAEVFLEDVRLPFDALLGDRGQGWTVAMSVLASERGHGTGAARALERRIDGAVAHAQEHDLDAVSRDQLVRLWIEGQSYLSMARQTSHGGPRSSLGKLALADYRFDLAEFAVNVEGPEGMLATRTSQGLVAAPGGWFGGGTTQVQRNIIGERVLGLPKEPKPNA